MENQKPQNQNEQENEALQEYNRLKNTSSPVPRSTNNHYCEDIYFKLTALTNTFQVGVQEMLTICVETTFAIANGVGAKEAIKGLTDKKPDSIFRRIVDIHRALHRLDKEKYPDISGMGSVNWEKELEDLKLVRHALQNGMDNNVQSVPAELNKVNYAISLIGNLIEAQAQLSKIPRYP